MSGWIVQLVTGLTLGLVLFLVASGLSLVFGVLRVLNFAHGSFFMVGAYLTYEIVGRSSGTSQFFIALLVAPLAVALLAMLAEVVLFRRVYDRPELHQLLLTFGLVFLVSGLIKEQWGAATRRVPVPELFRFPISVFDRVIPGYYVLPAAVALCIGIMLWLLLRRTSFGARVRAIAENREVAALAGIDPKPLYTVVFGLGAWLAAVAGVLLAPLQSLSPNMDQSIILQAFIIVVIGGLGSIAGSFLGAVLLGVMNAVGVQIFPRIALGLPFLLMAAVLILRPQGLLGKSGREV